MRCRINLTVSPLTYCQNEPIDRGRSIIENSRSFRHVSSKRKTLSPNGGEKMKLRLRRLPSARLIASFGALVAVALVVACGSDTEPTPQPPTPAPTVASEPESPAAETEPMGLPDSFESAIIDGLGDVDGFQGTTFAHGTFDTSQLAGKPIVINFWFPSCPPCRAELEHFENVYQQFGAPSGGNVEFVGVQQLGLDSIEDGANLFEELGVTFPGLPDNNSSIQIGYNIFSYPTTVFLDHNHNEHRVWQGAIDEENLVEIVREISEGATSAIDDGQIPAEGDAVAVPLVANDSGSTETELAEPEIVYAGTQTFTGLGDAPGFKGDTFHHGSFDLSEHEGKPVVINFWFPSCPPCRAEIPNFEHAYQTMGTPGTDEVVFIGVQAVGFDTAAEGVEFLGKMGANYPAIPDVGSAIHIAYQITAAPTTFFLDRDHNVLSVHQGYIKHNQLQDILDELTKV